MIYYYLGPWNVLSDFIDSVEESLDGAGDFLDSLEERSPRSQGNVDIKGTFVKQTLGKLRRDLCK